MFVQIVNVVVQEDVQVVGLFIFFGVYNSFFLEIIWLFVEQDVSDIFVFVGGIIFDCDIFGLKEVGIDVIFFLGMMMDEIVGYFEDWFVGS